MVSHSSATYPRETEIEKLLFTVLEAMPSTSQRATYKGQVRERERGKILAHTLIKHW